jgi:hypothetical protein
MRQTPYILDAVVQDFKTTFWSKCIIVIKSLFCIKWNSSDSKVCGYSLDDRVSVLGRGTDFCFYHNAKPVLGPTEPPFHWY